MHVRLGVRPVITLARVGLQIGLPLYARWNQTAVSARDIASRCGVVAGAPVRLQSPQPMSSCAARWLGESTSHCECHGHTFRCGDSIWHAHRHHEDKARRLITRPATRDGDSQGSQRARQHAAVAFSRVTSPRSTRSVVRVPASARRCSSAQQPRAAARNFAAETRRLAGARGGGGFTPGDLREDCSASAYVLHVCGAQTSSTAIFVCTVRTIHQWNPEATRFPTMCNTCRTAATATHTMYVSAP